MLELSDPKAYWLNMTNIGLGLVTLICLIALTRGVLLDVWERMRSRTADDHAFFEPELGVTMADGGERAEHKQS